MSEYNELYDLVVKLVQEGGAVRKKKKKKNESVNIIKSIEFYLIRLFSLNNF